MFLDLDGHQIQIRMFTSFLYRIYYFESFWLQILNRQQNRLDLLLVDFDRDCVQVEQNQSYCCPRNLYVKGFPVLFMFLCEFI